MNELGNKIAAKRKDLGMTQIELAEKMSVTRQTISRWEAGTVMPDIDKISDLADVLCVSCDYLLKDGKTDEESSPTRTAELPVSRLLLSLKGKSVRLTFFEDEADADLFNTTCRIVDYEGNWAKVEATTKKGSIEKLIPVSSIRSFELVKEDA